MTPEIMLAIGFVLFAIAIVLFLVPRKVKNEVNTTYYHDYLLSKDYGRFYDLLNEGRIIVFINGEGYPRRAKADKYSDGMYYFGFDSPLKLRNCSKEKFINYCEFMDIRFFDQVDKYETYL